jgi:phosphoribosyl 1,2-cyclic phosphodiesterase
VRVLIDAGLSFREICKRLRAVGQDPQELDAVLISHEHSDHIAGLRQLVKKTKAPIYLTGMTRDAIDWKDLNPTIETFQAGQRIAIGDLEIDTFTIPHDAIDPVMFCVRWRRTPSEKP